MAASIPRDSDRLLPWWSDRRYAVLLVLLSAVPLLWPDLPPLTDVLGHMARYHIQLFIDTSPYLHQWFGFKWALIGNLGVDLLVMPLARIFGLPLAVKLIVLAVPPITVAGLLLIAREVHGRIPPTAAFALPLAYGYPFQFGFLNYVLSMGLALLAFALWLRLARYQRFGVRAALFVPIGAILWVTHIFGWAVLGLLCFAAELVRDRGHGGSRFHAIWRAGLSLLPLAPPVAMMLLWRSGAVAGQTADWFHWTTKGYWIQDILRDRWGLFDIYSVALLVLLVLAGLLRFWVRIDRMLGIATLLLAIAFAMIPRILLGSAYADMRLAPYVLMIGVIALRPARPDRRRLMTAMAAAATLFFAARIGATTISFFLYDQAYDRQLAALDHVPQGARVMVMVKVKCASVWRTDRMDHLGSQTIVRKDGFANGQWAMPGAQLLTVDYPAAGRFGKDPSQILRPPKCRGKNEPLWADTLAHFPRPAYDYFWLINMPPDMWPHEPDLVPVWHGERGILFRIDHAAAQPSATIASDTPIGRVAPRSQ